MEAPQILTEKEVADIVFSPGDSRDTSEPDEDKMSGRDRKDRPERTARNSRRRACCRREWLLSHDLFVLSH